MRSLVDAYMWFVHDGTFDQDVVARATPVGTLHAQNLQRLNTVKLPARKILKALSVQTCF